MAFHKFSAARIFDGHQFLPAGTALICDDEGFIYDIVTTDTAGDDVQFFQGILSPGFINCHCHLELSHMKGLIPEKTGLIDFVFAVVTQRHFPDEEIRQAIADAEEQMRQNGIVAVGDICNNILTLSQKLKKNLGYYNFVESSGWLPDIAAQRFERSKSYFDQFTPHFSSSIVPHAPYSVSANLWQLLQSAYPGKVVSIHNQETVFEDELFIQNSGDFVRMYELMKLDTSFFSPSGSSSLQTYFHYLHQASRIILVHNTFTRQADLDFVNNSPAARKTSFCLCINANQYIEQSVPPVDLLVANNCHIVIGTDSLASNWGLSVLDELKRIQYHFPHTPLQSLLHWSTSNGATALEMTAHLGNFEKGKKPGIVLLENVGPDDSLKQATVKRLL